ncbi:glutamate racemase [Chloroflexia bacterium SDU3-3]|nr:glutamate racemase [Chloroflexia bacterium SDU3-3]
MIAFFDSGLGGLSVFSEVRSLLPRYDLAYFADSAFCPYGPKSVSFVRERSLTIGRWLIDQGAQMLVVACNTASSAALEMLRDQLPIPVVGMEPGLKPAVESTRSGRVGILATTGTLSGGRFHKLVERFAGGVEVLTQPCAGWVEQVEAGDLSSDTTRGMVARYVVPLVARGADTLVLGCTHYPFLRPLVSDVAGPGVSIIDTGPAVARQVARLVACHEIAPEQGRIYGWTSGDPADVSPVLRRLVREDMPLAHSTI